MVQLDVEAIFWQDFCAVFGVVAAFFGGWFLSAGYVVGAGVMAFAVLVSGFLYAVCGRGEIVDVDSD